MEAENEYCEKQQGYSLEKCQGSPLTFFFIALEHVHEKELLKALKEYAGEGKRLILAKERAPPPTHAETNGEHFHIAVDMTDKQYEAFKKTIILKRFKRIGVARNGVGRQYGKIHPSKVRDQTRFLTYTVKDKNYVSLNINIADLKKLEELSFEKKDLKTQSQLCMEELVRDPPCLFPEYWKIYEPDISQIEKRIVGYYLGKNQRLCKSVMKLLTVEYLMKHMPNKDNYRDAIYNYIKNS